MYEDLRGELENIRTVLALDAPFLASLLRRCRIIADQTISTACVTENREMRVNPEFIKPLTIKQRVFVYGHEALHVALHHLQRMEGKDRRIANIAADGAVNGIMMAHGFDETIANMVTPELLAKKLREDPKKIAALSFEELYALLMKHEKAMRDVRSSDDLQEHMGGDGTRSEGGSSSENQDTARDPSVSHDGVLTGDDKNEERSKQGILEKLFGKQSEKNEAEKPHGNVLQDGDAEAYDGAKTPEEQEEFWKEAVAQAAAQAKIAGNLPGEIERLLEELLTPKVNWKHLIKQEIMNGLGRNVISTWTRPSRKHENFPGVKRISIPNVWFLPDTSGSMSEQEITQAISEAYGIAKLVARLIVIPWDAEAYPRIEIRKPRDIALTIHMLPGGGGTVIAPALKETLASMRFGDIVVVITDGDIHDLDTDETKLLMGRIGSKSEKAIFATIRTINILPSRWRQIKIEL